MSRKILDVENLRVSFKGREQDIQAVRGIDFFIEEGEILGIVGESGSGKSVAMKSILGILPKNAKVNSDKLLLNETNLSNISEDEYRKIRGSKITMIFQDPMTALNPLVRIGKQIEEVIIRHQKCTKAEAKNRAIQILKQVGISIPKQRMKQYPHEFSGGMRQRVLIAMALACEPELLIADEPTTALDVTIQAQILDILRELQQKYNMSIALITHDMGVVASMCTRVIIFYGGLIMESGTVDEIFYNPQHPYTKALLKAIPSTSLKEGERLKSIPGLPPSLANPPKGCPFSTRCEFAFERCHNELPKFVQHSDTQFSACFLNKEGKINE